MEVLQGVEGQDEKEEQHQPGVHVYKKRTTEVGENSSVWCYILPTTAILRIHTQPEGQTRKLISFQVQNEVFKITI